MQPPNLHCITLLIKLFLHHNETLTLLAVLLCSSYAGTNGLPGEAACQLLFPQCRLLAAMLL
jgi:hypothetical protein